MMRKKNATMEGHYNHGQTKMMLAKWNFVLVVAYSAALAHNHGMHVRLW